MNPLDYRPDYRRNLPHHQPPGATLFVTYRLAGSLPRHVVDKLKTDREENLRRAAAVADAEKRAEYEYLLERQSFDRWDSALDAADSGPRWLSRSPVRAYVQGSLHHLDGRHYDLDSYCVMSNHVHALFTPLTDEDGMPVALARIMHALKGFSARRANALLGRRGTFWQHESYDHVVRDEDELRRIRLYVLNNPVTAGLVDCAEEWPGNYCKYWD